MKYLLTSTFRLLRFGASRDEMLRWDNRHLLWGIFGTWVVGMGRYWDNPRASLPQHLGVGSVVYIFCLAAFIWLVVRPLRVPDWSYKTVLTFIALTSFPAILYAIPVEKFMSIRKAIEVNVWFLAVVAFWRLCLLGWFLRKFAQMGAFRSVVVLLLPMAAIVTSLSFLNLEHVIFDIMGGLRDTERSGNDGAYRVVIGLTLISVFLVVPLTLAYLYFVYDTYRRGRMGR
jgi:hypothetical protein